MRSITRSIHLFPSPLLSMMNNPFSSPIGCDPLLFHRQSVANRSQIHRKFPQVLAHPHRPDIFVNSKTPSGHIT
jgi:hypothetical protein